MSCTLLKSNGLSNLSIMISGSQIRPRVQLTANLNHTVKVCPNYNATARESPASHSISKIILKLQHFQVAPLALLQPLVIPTAACCKIRGQVWRAYYRSRASSAKIAPSKMSSVKWLASKANSTLSTRISHSRWCRTSIAMAKRAKNKKNKAKTSIPLQMLVVLVRSSTRVLHRTRSCWTRWCCRQVIHSWSIVRVASNEDPAKSI